MGVFGGYWGFLTGDLEDMVIPDIIGDLIWPKGTFPKIALPQPNPTLTHTPTLPQPNLNLNFLVGGELLYLVYLSLSRLPSGLSRLKLAIYSKTLP